MAEDSAFKILMEPVLSTLGIAVNEHNIMERIIVFSRNIKTEISNDLKGILFSLKIDVATRMDFSMLGINVQYIKGGKFNIKTLAVKELKSRHTADYLKSLILEVLSEYGVDARNILSITTDNGSNMLKTVKMLNSDLQLLVDEEVLDDEDDNDVDCQETINNIESIDFTSPYQIINVRCGAHTLQLCVNDVLKLPAINKTYLSILKNGLHKKPIIDCATRWNSTYNMVVRLLEMREMFVGLFKPIYTATMKLQTEQLCYSELFVIIMDITFQIDALPNTEMKTVLKESLKARTDKLLDNELFNAAVFLDPRIKVCITRDQKQRAKKYIESLYKRINSIEESTAYNTVGTIPDEIPSRSTSSTAKSFSEYLQIIDPTTYASNFSNLRNLESEFSIYERQPRLPLNGNVMEYWDSQKNIISGIANIVLAIPSTQVSVERLFSAMKYVLSDQRNRLSAQNLEHILMVKVNGIFNYQLS
ncbi:uncharacterized protein [Musca autumnalis]|uniref:uncharacterized protein n=1 Tax=Musca autumnalis TaxID=221902 RepID=UPI003CEDCBB8